MNTIGVLLFLSLIGSSVAGVCYFSEWLCKGSCYTDGCLGGGSCDENGKCICDCPDFSCVAGDYCFIECLYFQGCKFGQCNGNGKCECDICAEGVQTASDPGTVQGQDAVAGSQRGSQAEMQESQESEPVEYHSPTWEQYAEVATPQFPEWPAAAAAE